MQALGSSCREIVQSYSVVVIRLVRKTWVAPSGTLICSARGFSIASIPDHHSG